MAVSPCEKDRPAFVSQLRQVIVDHPETVQTTTILWLFTDKQPGGAGCARVGKIILPDDVQAYLSDQAIAEDQEPPEVIVVLNRTTWDASGAEEQTGNLDHMLSHLLYDHDNEKWTRQQHDVGEFTAVVRRRGAYSDLLVPFARVCQNLELPPPLSSEYQQATLGSTSNGAATVNGTTADPDAQARVLEDEEAAVPA